MALIQETSAGALVLWNGKALLIRVRRDTWEFPKGHVEAGESPETAAERELLEETGIQPRPALSERLGEISYSFDKRGDTIQKSVIYFSFRLPGDVTPGFSLPKGTREIQWVDSTAATEVALVNEELRGLLLEGLSS